MARHMSSNVSSTPQPTEIGQWLRGLGLGRLEPAFVENAIDFDVLADLTESDLENLGFPLGDRKRLIRAIRTMLADSRGALSNELKREPHAEQPRLAVAERRHLTVMICDLV